MRRAGGAWLAVTSLLAGSALAAVDPIVIKGSKFFYQNSGAQFFIKGLAYGQASVGVGAASGSAATKDPLANPSGCKRDVKYLQELETNVVRVYYIDTSQDHDECMSTFADAGIYVLADLSSPTESIDRYSPEWTDDLYAYYASVVDLMQKYPNTLGFFAGNEVAYAPNSTASAPFVKAAVRDMKAYIAQKGYRTIGVGYATDDNQFVRAILADYFNCGDQTDAVDFWGYNIYSWCGVSGYVESGYAARTAEFSTYSVPVFFAEYGCNTVEPRPFDEVLALFGPNMSQVFSGGVVYEYFQDPSNDYGLVTIGSNSQATTLTDFTNLKTQIAKVSPLSTSINAYTPSNQPAACPSSQMYFRAQATPLPPTPNEELCSCMYEALSCIVKPGTSVLDYKSDFNYVCSQTPGACAGFAHDASTGTYGAYSMCNATQQLGWAFDYYYRSQNKASTACDFNGHAELHTPTKLNSVCSNLVNQAGSSGQGTVTSSPTTTGAGAAAAGASNSKGAASSLRSAPSEGWMPLISSVLAAAFVSGVAAVLL